LHSTNAFSRTGSCLAKNRIEIGVLRDTLERDVGGVLS
jgi:hypothetical protein